MTHRKDRNRQIVEDLRRQRQELANRTIGTMSAFDSSMTPIQRSAREMASILNCNAWHVDNSSHATWTIHGRPSVHAKLISVMLELIQEQGCWKNVSVVHPTVHAYGSEFRSIKHEIDFTAEFIPDHSG